MICKEFPDVLLKDLMCLVSIDKTNEFALSPHVLSRPMSAAAKPALLLRTATHYFVVSLLPPPYSVRRVCSYLMILPKFNSGLQCLFHLAEWSIDTVSTITWV